ncbi:DUF4304 domain-containing protein [Pseudomonas chlororaphis]|uniref:ABC-three component system middle component 1 n=1 Tax=Pseudomonas chlororaphis TaxID=587753 RepID=UPI0039E1B50B
MNLLSKEYDLSFLSSRFENMSFRLYVSDDAISYISCIACSCDTSAQIVESWNAIQNYVSGYYQPPGELGVWNVYLAFFCVEKFPLWEKYEIENDKYAVRKIILDDLEGLPSDDRIIESLSRQLLGADLVLEESVLEPAREVSMSLEKYIRGAPLDSKVESKEMRARMVNNIIEFLNGHENQKG